MAREQSGATTAVPPAASGDDAAATVAAGAAAQRDASGLPTDAPEQGVSPGSGTATEPSLDDLYEAERGDPQQRDGARRPDDDAEATDADDQEESEEEADADTAEETDDPDAADDEAEEPDDEADPDDDADDEDPDADDSEDDDETEDDEEGEDDGEDQDASPRAKKRIKRLINERNALRDQVQQLEADTAIVQTIDQWSQQTGLPVEEIGDTLDLRARLYQGDPDVIPVLEQALKDLRAHNQIPEPQPAAPAIPQLKPFQGDLPAELEEAVAYGVFTEAQARRYAAASQYAEDVQQLAKQDAAGSDAEATPGKQAAQREIQRRQAEAQQRVNAEVDAFLQEEGVTPDSLGDHYRKLLPHLNKLSPTGHYNDIPLEQQFAAVRKAHVAVKRDEAARAQTTEKAKKRKRKRPPNRQSSGPRRGAPKHDPGSLDAFYEEERGGRRV